MPRLRHHALPLWIFLAGALTPLARAAGPTDSKAEPAIEFLDVEAAGTAILDDSKQPYFSQFESAEMSAKTALDVPDKSPEKRLEVVKQQYREAVREFAPEEKLTIRWYLERLKTPLTDDYPLFAAVPWKFIKVRGNLEGGMPHTRGDYIVLSERVIASMGDQKQNVPPAAAMARMGGMLVHEKLHVLQRRDPERFVDLYENVWGFEKVKHIQDREKLRSRWIVNPDGPDVKWVMPLKETDGTVRYVWPLILFASAAHPTLERMQMTAVSIQTTGEKFSVELNASGEPVTGDLLGDRAYRAKFFPSTYIYHPNEAAADLFSRVVVMDHFGGKDAIQELPDAERIGSSLELYRKWFKLHLAAP